MWAKTIGAFFILSGAAFLISPERLRRRLQKKTLRTMRRYLFATVCCLGILLVYAGWTHEGTLAKVLIVAGIIVLVKGLYLLKAKAADMIVAWLIKLPAVCFRVFAVCQILAGGVIIWGLER